MKKHILKIAGVLLLAISLTACGQGSAPAPTPTEAAAPPTSTPAKNQNLPRLCKNEYFPVKANAEYHYSSTGSPSGSYSFTRRIGKVTADSFVIVTSLRKSNITQTWSCKPEGLIPTQLGITDAASAIALRNYTDLTASNIVGYFLPPSLTPGATWTYSMDIQGTQAAPSAGSSPASMTGRVTITYTVGNKESVTVPAGTFDAFAIEVNTVIDFTTTSGNADATDINSAYTAWYASGVGWIKSAGYGSLGKQKYVETIVLDSYELSK